MSGGSNKRQSSGFTIVEVMIVLAVGGAMLIGALRLINGKQNITAFNQSVRNVQTQMQQVVNEVGSGYYQSSKTIACDDQGVGGALQLTSSTTAPEQGANLGCTFMGKMLQMGIGTGPETFNVYTVVGKQDVASSPSINFTNAKARLLARGAGGAPETSVPDVFTSNNLQYGLTMSRPYYQPPNHPSDAFLAFGFISSLKSIGSTDTSQQVQLVTIAGNGLGLGKPAAVDSINTALKNNAVTINRPEGVKLCFNSGIGTSGLISIGGSSRQGTVDLQIFSKVDCAP